MALAQSQKSSHQKPTKVKASAKAKSQVNKSHQKSWHLPKPPKAIQSRLQWKCTLYCIVRKLVFFSNLFKILIVFNVLPKVLNSLREKKRSLKKEKVCSRVWTPDHLATVHQATTKPHRTMVNISPFCMWSKGPKFQQSIWLPLSHTGQWLILALSMWSKGPKFLIH